MCLANLVHLTSLNVGDAYDDCKLEHSSQPWDCIAALPLLQLLTIEWTHPVDILCKFLERTRLASLTELDLHIRRALTEDLIKACNRIPQLRTLRLVAKGHIMLQRSFCRHELLPLIHLRRSHSLNHLVVTNVLDDVPTRNFILDLRRRLVDVFIDVANIADLNTWPNSSRDQCNCFPGDSDTEMIFGDDSDAETEPAPLWPLPNSDSDSEDEGDNNEFEEGVPEQALSQPDELMLEDWSDW